MSLRPRLSARTDRLCAGGDRGRSLGRCQGTPSPRPGLTAQQTRQAVDIARESLVELRKKTEGAARPDADRREYVVGVELLAAKEPESPSETSAAESEDRASGRVPGKHNQSRGERKSHDETAGRGARAAGPGHFVPLLRRHHRLRDRRSGSGPDRQSGGRPAPPHRPLGRGIRGGQGPGEGAQRAGQGLYQKFGDKLSVNPQFSQFTVKGDPRIHRVIHLTYRVGTRDLSYPRPIVDLTTREVATPAPEVFPKPRRPTR